MMRIYQINYWKNPDDNIIRFKLLESQYATSFLEHGSLKFNSLNFWVNYAREKGVGKGDFFESTLAFCDILDINAIKELDEKFSPKQILNTTDRPFIKY